MEKIDVKALAIGLGLSWGLGMLLVGEAAAFGWGGKFVDVISSVYIGFAPTLLGGVIGGIWGFFDGAIGGALIALFYNAFAKKK